MANGNKTRKRGNGEGTVFYNQGKKLWVAQYVVNMKRKTIYAKTKAEAREKLIKAQNSIFEGTYIDTSKTTVREWLDLWLNTYVIGKKAPKTAECYHNVIKNHIVPGIGSMLIKDLQAIHVQQLYNEVEKKSSPRMASLVHVTLHAALKQAVFNDMISRNVTDRCIPPKYEPKKARALTIDEQREFVKAIRGNRFELAFLMCLYTGLRRGEALALTWDDIDMEKSMVHIRKTVVRVTNFGAEKDDSKTIIIVKAPKSRSGHRSIPIPKELIPLLKQHRMKTSKEKLRAGGEYQDDGYLFCDALGGPIAPDQMNRAFTRTTRGLFDTKATLHTLRHTYATRGAEQGVSMKVMQELMGHSKIDLTANIYTHVSSELKKQEVAKMSVILG